MEITKEIIDQQNNITEGFQNECHKFIETLVENKAIGSYQDLTNVWLFRKLAEFEMRLKELEDRPQHITYSNKII